MNLTQLINLAHKCGNSIGGHDVEKYSFRLAIHGYTQRSPRHISGTVLRAHILVIQGKHVGRDNQISQIIHFRLGYLTCLIYYRIIIEVRQDPAYVALLIDSHRKGIKRRIAAGNGTDDMYLLVTVYNHRGIVIVMRLAAAEQKKSQQEQCR